MKTSTNQLPLLSLMILCIIALSSCSLNQSVVHVPAQQKVTIDLPNKELYRAELQNRSLKNIDISVQSKATDEQVRGFGLAPKGNAKVKVEKANVLQISNPNAKSVRVRLRTSPMVEQAMPESTQMLSLVLINTTSKSIPLWIPSVMNPNLSPNSKSNVRLKMGQKIYYKDGLKKKVLFEVDNSISEGDTIDIAALLEKMEQS